MSDREDAAISPLVADVLTSMLTQTQQATESVIDDLTSDLDRARAVIGLIREDIYALLDGPYMPTPGAIADCLYPAPERVAAAIEVKRSARS